MMEIVKLPRDERTDEDLDFLAYEFKDIDFFK
jgi:hypothetical protein